MNISQFISPPTDGCLDCSYTFFSYRLFFSGHLCTCLIVSLLGDFLGQGFPNIFICQNKDRKGFFHGTLWQTDEREMTGSLANSAQLPS